MRRILAAISMLMVLAHCDVPMQELDVHIVQTSASGDHLSVVQPSSSAATDTVKIDPTAQYQEIVGFGGAFTESSAWLLRG